MLAHWSTPIEVGGFVYGFSGRHEPEGELRCVDLATGNVVWKTRGYDGDVEQLADGRRNGTDRRPDHEETDSLSVLRSRFAHKGGRSLSRPGGTRHVGPRRTVAEGLSRAGSRVVQGHRIPGLAEPRRRRQTTLSAGRKHAVVRGPFGKAVELGVSAGRSHFPPRSFLPSDSMACIEARRDSSKPAGVIFGPLR